MKKANYMKEAKKYKLPVIKSHIDVKYIQHRQCDQ